MKNHILLFESWKAYDKFNIILENVSSDIQEIKSEVDSLIKDLSDEDSDAVKAAALLQAITKDGDLEKLDVEAIKDKGDKQNESTMNESVSGVFYGLELIGNILGNAALMEFIAKQIHKATGTKPDTDKLIKTIQGVTDAIAKVTGYPGEAILKFLEWITEKIGVKNKEARTGLALLGKLVGIIFLFGLGVAHFPVLGTGILWWLLSLTGLIGKSIEVVEIGRHIVDLIIDAPNDPESVKELGVKSADLSALVV